MEEGMDGEERVLAAVTRPARRAPPPRRPRFAAPSRRSARAASCWSRPYSARTTTEEAEFLRAAAARCSTRRPCARRQRRLLRGPPGFWRERVIEAARRAADAYLLSCANIAALGIIDELERRLDRPVVTSNQAVLWDALARLGHGDVGGCPGACLSHP